MTPEYCQWANVCYIHAHQSPLYAPPPPTFFNLWICPSAGKGLQLKPHCYSDENGQVDEGITKVEAGKLELCVAGEIDAFYP